jgi:hypothetical protein
MPATLKEAKEVYCHYDRLNGRYYVKADVVLVGGGFLRDVGFDGDYAIAVEVDGRPVYDQPGLIGRRVEAALVTQDYSAGGRFGNASEAERQRFGNLHQQKERPA